MVRDQERNKKERDKNLDRINRIDRIVACGPEADQAINHRLRRKEHAFASYYSLFTVFYEAA